MLTDIFACRYQGIAIWDEYGKAERRLLVQCLQIIAEEVLVIGLKGKSNPGLISACRKLTRELGVTTLAPELWAQHSRTQPPSVEQVLQAFLLAVPAQDVSPDEFMKQRISLVELAFRERETEMHNQNNTLESEIKKADERAEMFADALASLNPRFKAPSNSGATEHHLRTMNRLANEGFARAKHELNERFIQAGSDLHYHNGFIQIRTDSLIETEVHAPFWEVISGKQWANVESDMLDAIDQRDNGHPKAASPALHALESTIKIISRIKGLDRGKERSAPDYLDNLSEAELIEKWESDVLKKFFSTTRNRLDHGPGVEPMPALSREQSDAVIGTCMSWIRALVLRA